jgi:4-diphosphocytidyl-2-C-methyl-D-erythritol kinase
MKKIFKAFAKINLFLDVLGKREDGYHSIRSVVVPISLADEIEVEEVRKGTELLADEEVLLKGLPWTIPLCNNGANLIMKAVELFRKKTGIKKGLKIKLKKHIPVGAGLGGGSADAAAILNALNEMWSAGFSKEELLKLGLEIGCDIPAMLYRAPVLMEGKGGEVSTLAWKEGFTAWVLLIYPGFSISTADMYSRWDKDGLSQAGGKRRYDLQVKGMERGAFDMVGRGMYNALERVAFKKYPILEILKKELELAGANYVLLTGSGSVLFALAREEKEARSIEKTLRKKVGFPLWVKVEQINPSFKG